MANETVYTIRLEDEFTVAMRRADAAVEGFNQSAGREATVATAELTAGLNRAEAELAEFGARAAATGAQTKSALAGAATATVGLTAGLGRVGASLAALANPAAIATAGMVALGAAFAGAVKFLGDSAAAFAEAEAVAVRFRSSVEGIPGATSEAIAGLEAQSVALGRLTGQGDDAILTIQAMQAAMGLTAQQVAATTPVIADFAAKTGQDLTTATTLVTRALQGNTTALGRQFQNLKAALAETQTFDERLRVLAQFGLGAAAAQGETLAVRMDRVRDAFGEVQEATGGLLGQSKAVAAVLDVLATRFLNAADGLSDIEKQAALFDAALVKTLQALDKFAIGVRETYQLVVALNPFQPLNTSAAALAKIIRGDLRGALNEFATLAERVKTGFTFDSTKTFLGEAADLAIRGGPPPLPTFNEAEQKTLNAGFLKDFRTENKLRAELIKKLNLAGKPLPLDFEQRFEKFRAERAAVKKTAPAVPPAIRREPLPPPLPAVSLLPAPAGIKPVFDAFTVGAETAATPLEHLSNLVAQLPASVGVLAGAFLSLDQAAAGGGLAIAAERGERVRESLAGLLGIATRVTAEVASPVSLLAGAFVALGRDVDGVAARLARLRAANAQALKDAETQRSFERGVLSQKLGDLRVEQAANAQAVETIFAKRREALESLRQLEIQAAQARATSEAERSTSLAEVNAQATRQQLENLEARGAALSKFAEQERRVAKAAADAEKDRIAELSEGYSTFFTDVLEGRLNSLRDIGNAVLDQLKAKLLELLAIKTAAAVGGGGGGFLGDLLGGLSGGGGAGLASLFGGRAAGGGAVFAGGVGGAVAPRRASVDHSGTITVQTPGGASVDVDVVAAVSRRVANEVIGEDLRSGRGPISGQLLTLDRRRR